MPKLAPPTSAHSKADVAVGTQNPLPVGEYLLVNSRPCTICYMGVFAFIGNKKLRLHGVVFVILTLVLQ